MEHPSLLANGDPGGPAEVHQAVGMLTVQLGVNISEALVKLRAHADATHRALVDVARDIIARRLQLSPPGKPD